MDFSSLCCDELMKVECGTIMEYGGTSYFSLTRLNCITGIVRDSNTIGDLVITPYFLFDEQWLELYDYTLSIRIVRSLRPKEQFFLEETGKVTVNEIDKKILEKLDNTYFEVLGGDIQTFVRFLEQYLAYMNGQEHELLESIKRELSISTTTEGEIFYNII